MTPPAAQRVSEERVAELLAYCAKYADDVRGDTEHEPAHAGIVAVLRDLQRLRELERRVVEAVCSANSSLIACEGVGILDFMDRNSTEGKTIEALLTDKSDAG